MITRSVRTVLRVADVVLLSPDTHSIQLNL